ncbi:MAG: hypothetical protein A7315_13050 [Candidatus Altiarchaeales archaeon WOR_SM1_79]|nr:MAG: hypothetical protein A7315_13050 [Candidatus Altiarchaeales archaeon WOR_SM1_79]
MFKIQKIFILSVILVSGLLLGSATAASVAVSPTTLNYEKTLKGAQNQKQFVVFNTENKEANYEIYAKGNISDWFSFSETIIKIPPKEKAKIVVTVTPPSDIPNGIYEDVIYIKEITNVTGGAGASVGISPAAGIKTTINIVEDEIIAGVVHRISAENNEIGEPIKFLIKFSNTGNVRAAPKITIKITRGRENMETIEKEVTVFAGQNKDIAAEWETLNREVGEYAAYVEVLLNDKKLADERIVFKILPEGALTKNAVIISVNSPGEVESGNPAKIEVVVKNTGAGSINAKITGEVYLDNELVDTLNGENFLIYQGQTGTPAAYFKSEDAGVYLIKGNVLYEGKSIKMDDITITVKSAKEEKEVKVEESSSQPVSISPAVIIIIITAVLILILAVFIFRRFK